MKNGIMNRQFSKPTRKFRFERKYLLDTDTAFLLKKRLSYILLPDTSSPDGQYFISSLYFDDNYNTSFYEKQNGVLARNKFRVRFYNNNFNFLRLERKYKHGEMISKISTIITNDQYQMMCHGDYTFMRDFSNDTFKEFYTTHLTRHMRPAIMIHYDRQAYVYQAGNVRITFDSGLVANSPMKESPFSVLPDENVILEIKYDNFIPSVITELFSGVQFTQQLALSKFSIGRLALQGR